MIDLPIIHGIDMQRHPAGYLSISISQPVDDFYGDETVTTVPDVGRITDTDSGNLSA